MTFDPQEQAARYLENWRRWHAHQKELGRATPQQDRRARIREAADAVEALFLDEDLIGMFGGFTADSPPVALAAAVVLWLQDLDAALTKADDQAQEN